MRDKIPTFELTSRTTAITYHFVVPETLGGWATCTINDATGELLVMSDWGNWSHRWNVRHIGPSRHNPARVMSLTEFIADRQACDYLAGKLAGEERRQFDAEETCKALKRTLCLHRLEQGRANRNLQPEDLDDEERADPEVKIEECLRHAEKRDWHGFDEPLTRGIARDIWDRLSGELASTDNEHVFWERLWHVPGILWVSEEPWSYAVHRQSHAYEILVRGILPALVAAASARLAEITPVPPPVNWAGDLAALEAELDDYRRCIDEDSRAAARRVRAGLAAST